MKIYNATEQSFGGKLRKGDVVQLTQILLVISQFTGEAVKVFLPEDILFDEADRPYFTFLEDNSPFFSEEPGNIALPYLYHFWYWKDALSNAFVPVINNPYKIIKNQICIIPLHDGYYETHRNWSFGLDMHLAEQFSLLGLQVVFASKEVCTLEESVRKVCQSEFVVVGQTGFSYFASALSTKNKIIGLYDLDNCFLYRDDISIITKENMRFFGVTPPDKILRSDPLPYDQGETLICNFRSNNIIEQVKQRWNLTTD